MKKTIKISETTTIVFTKDEHGFQEVLDDLPNAKTVDVITFNISSKDSDLLQKIKDLAPHVRLRVVTNIPNRYVRYYGEKASERARGQIRHYLDQLNPTNYTAEMSAFFSYDTHCKVIATDNVAYMGSGNFSDESASNFECGVIIRDKASIEELVDMVFGDVTERADEHQGNPIATTIIQLNAIGARIKSIRSEYKDLFYSETDDYPYQNDMYFEVQDVRASEADLDAMYNLMDELEGVLDDMEEDENQEDVAWEFSRTHMESIRDKLGMNKPIHDFISHDSQSFMENWLEDHRLSNDFDAKIEQASDEDGERRSDLADKAYPEVEALLSDIDMVISEIQKATESLKNLNLANLHINNT